MADKINMLAQAVKLIGNKRGHFHFVDGSFNLVQPREQGLPLSKIRLLVQLPLQSQQRPILPVNPPDIEMRNAAQDRNQDHDGGDKNHDDPAGQACQPERKIMIEKTRTRFIKAGRIGTDGKVMLDRRGELALVLQQ